MSGTAPVVLFQSSDWRVGRPVPVRGVGWSDELREDRRREIDAIAERCVLAALEAGADVLLLAGDLWEADCVGTAAVDSILDALEAFAPRPVFVVPGTRDGGVSAPWFEPRVLTALGARAWPENVHVFRGRGWAAQSVPGVAALRVVGRGPLASGSGGPGLPARDGLTVLLAHAPELDGDEDGVRRLARDAGARWTALGHRASALVVCADDGSPVGGFAGCPSGASFDEVGPRSFLKVVLEAGRPPVVTHVPSDDRTFRDLVLEVGGRDPSTAADAARALLSSCGASPRDVVRLTLSGRAAAGFSLTALADSLRPLAAHLSLREAPLSGAEDGTPATVEARFQEDLFSQASAAEGRARRVAELALVVGRRVLHGRPVTVPPLEEF